MRSTLALSVFALFLALGVSPALAASPKNFSGQILRVDSAAKTFVVKTASVPASEMSFQLAPDAKILLGTRALDLDQLKSGEHVKVTYLDEGMLHRAQKVEVMAPKAASAKPAKKPMTP
jgi:hypothetical protein